MWRQAKVLSLTFRGRSALGGARRRFLTRTSSSTSNFTEREGPVSTVPPSGNLSPWLSEVLATQLNISPSEVAPKEGISGQIRSSSSSSAKSKNKSKRASSSASAPSAAEEEFRRSSASLVAFCGACAEAGLARMAVEKLESHRARWRFEATSSCLGDPNLFSAFLAVAAKPGIMMPEDLASVLTMMLEDRVMPDSKCLSNLFVAMGVLPAQEDDFHAARALALGRTLMEAVSTFQVEMAHVEARVRPRERALLLEGTRRVFSRDFKPPESIPEGSSYNCLLLKDFDETECLVAPSLSSGVENFKSLLERQLRLEEEGKIRISSVQTMDTKCLDSSDNVRLCTEASDTLMEFWQTALEVALQEKLDRLLRARSVLPENLVTPYPFLKILPVSEYIAVMRQELSRMLSESESYSPTVSNVHISIGMAVLSQIRCRQVLGHDFDQFLEAYDKYVDVWFRDPAGANLGWCHREAFHTLVTEKYIRPSYEWPFSICVAIGRELLNILMCNVTVKVDKEGHLIVDNQSIIFSKDGKLTQKAVSGQAVSCPALFKVFRRRKNLRQFEEIKPHPELHRLFSAEKRSYLEFDSTAVPMVVPPLPWTSVKDGGFLIRDSQFLRATRGPSAEDLQDDRELRPLFDSLNQLGSVPWKINGPLLDFVIEVFTNQDRHGDILSRLSVPRHQDMLVLPKIPPALQKKLEERSMDKSDMEEYNRFLAEKVAFNQFKSETYSNWCDTLYRLSIANHFRDEILYFPHNIDFRGRVYPIAPYLNHMGGDMARSLLVFAEPKPLGPRGLDWLKLHAVNLTGLKKRSSVQERLLFAEECLPAILRSAEAPFAADGDWWLKSDEPWQTLGVCLEIRDALNYGGNPEDFLSSLPVHQDGSCNGLQHYAALGRDVLGASSVNVLPAAKPQDVYSEIAAIVEKKRREDASSSSSSSSSVARTLDGFVQRKVVKQTVMTTVYGVTRYGARLQIAKQLKDLEDFPLEEVDKASAYLAGKTFESLNEMFRASQEIQAWLTECANVLSGELRRTVAWKTPLGLVVSQPYFKTLKRAPNDVDDPGVGVVSVLVPNTQKQKNGFPPNFVHSLDSSHMMLTSVHMWRRGLTFASVHDCFWTHACSVEEMNRICREQFVSLHEHPILEELAESFKLDLERDSAVDPTLRARAAQLFSALPVKGELELQKVKDSVYFFS